AGVSIHLGFSVDETSALCTWHLNRAHYLEAWGDGRAWDGTYSVAQPLIEPLFGGRSAIELMALVNGDAVTDGETIVRRSFDDMVGGGDDRRWRQVLKEGVLPGSAFTATAPAVRRNAIAAAIEPMRQSWQQNRDGWEVTFAAHPTVYDGRFTNNGWLQELPDPISKLTWDNAVLVSPAAADTLDLETGDRVTVEVGGVSVEAAVMRLPGIADRSAVLHLGYGRWFTGGVCAGAGFDFYPLRTTRTMGAASATIAKASGHYPLAGTQDHHTIDAESVGGRGVQKRLPSLFREASLDHYREHPRFAHDAEHTGAHVVHRLSTWAEDNLAGADHAWAMTIDLNSCVGCGACIVACQAENNIPIVGKDQVLRGREMHWIRLDRYFKFGRTEDGWNPDDVRSVALQPVACMMCENAPCEQVCPVAATVHDRNGLNVMVYNRCVGTRYCSNNCPYKVRRFNYFDFRRRGPLRQQPGLLLQVEPDYFTRTQSTTDSPLPEMQFNPDVTVRMRGVMEKCTYCVQRIMQGKIEAKNAYASRPEEEKAVLKDERIGIPDGSITPACAQTCPGEAIVFGDLRDTTSRVARLHQTPRAYEMLEELHVKARTKYLAKVWNPGYHVEEHHDGHPTPAHESEGAAHS
ncbi:MAG: 4Fe-4S dicluster domain-containing protein, partial [Phycisphaerales bacterium]|nr:4Fe-4S dicluster domain-containing protein [Phycisphaerales bacterium]